MLRNFRTLYQYRDLLWLWTLRTIRVRYKQSLLGTLWVILQPLSLMLIFTIVFSLFVRVPTEGIPYPVFSYTALLPWTFFATSISFGITCLTNNLNLITKIYFPREILPIAVVAAGLFDFLVGLVMFILLLFFFDISISAWFLMVPILLGIQMIFTLGIVLIASAMNVYYRDIQFVTPLLLQLLMFASPIVYPVSLVPKQYLWLYMLNPLSALIQSYRDVTLFNQSPNWAYLLFAAAVSLVIFTIGLKFFKHAEPEFADII